MFENMNKTKAHRTLSRRDGVISPTEMRRLKAALAQLDDLDERIEPEDDWDDSVHFACFLVFVSPVPGASLLHRSSRGAPNGSTAVLCCEPRARALN